MNVGKREDALLDQISELVHHRDATLHRIHAWQYELPALTPILDDLADTLTTGTSTRETT